MAYCSECGTERAADGSCPNCGAVKPPEPQAAPPADLSGQGYPSAQSGYFSQEVPAQGYGTQPPPAYPPEQAPWTGGPAYAAGAPSHPYAPSPAQNPSPLLPGARPGATEILPGLAVAGLLLVTIVILSGFTDDFTVPMNILNIMRQFCIMAPLAVATALTTRAHGPDFSLGYAYALCTLPMVSAGNIVTALLAAMFLGCLLGLFNGVFVHFLKLPSIGVTLVTGQLIRGISLAISEGKPVHLDDTALSHVSDPNGFLYFMLLAIPAATAIFFIAFSPLGAAFSQRTAQQKASISMFLAYPIAGIFVGMAAVAFAFRFHSFQPTVGGFEVEIAFFWAGLLATRAVDNRVGPVFYVLLLALLYRLASNLLNLLNISSFTQNIVFTVLALLMLAAAGAVRLASQRRAAAQAAPPPTPEPMGGSAYGDL